MFLLCVSLHYEFEWSYIGLIESCRFRFSMTPTFDFSTGKLEVQEVP